jgi:hypothetical protein
MWAMRLDRPKKPVIAAMSQASSASNPWSASCLVVGVAHGPRLFADLDGEVEHGHLTWADIGLAVVRGDDVGDERVLLEDPQHRSVRDDAVEAVIDRRGGHDDHLPIGLGQVPRLLLHERVVVGEEGAEFVRSAGQGEEDVGHEARLLGDLEDLGADVIVDVVDVSKWVSHITHASPGGSVQVEPFRAIQ